MIITFNVRGLNRENCKVNIKTTDQKNWFNINGVRRYEEGLTGAIYAGYVIAFQQNLGVR